MSLTVSANLSQHIRELLGLPESAPIGVEQVRAYAMLRADEGEVGEAYVGDDRLQEALGLVKSSPPPVGRAAAAVLQHPVKPTYMSLSSSYPPLNDKEVSALLAGGSHPDIVMIGGQRHLYFEEEKASASGQRYFGLVMVHEGKASCIFGYLSATASSESERKKVAFFNSVKEAHDNGTALGEEATRYYRNYMRLSHYRPIDAAKGRWRDSDGVEGTQFFEGRDLWMKAGGDDTVLVLPKELAKRRPATDMLSTYFILPIGQTVFNRIRPPDSERRTGLETWELYEDVHGRGIALNFREGGTLAEISHYYRGLQPAIASFRDLVRYSVIHTGFVNPVPFKESGDVFLFSDCYWAAERPEAFQFFSSAKRKDGETLEVGLRHLEDQEWHKRRWRQMHALEALETPGETLDPTGTYGEGVRELTEIPRTDFRLKRIAEYEVRLQEGNESELKGVFMYDPATGQTGGFYAKTERGVQVSGRVVRINDKEEVGTVLVDGIRFSVIWDRTDRTVALALSSFVSASDSRLPFSPAGFMPVGLFERTDKLSKQPEDVVLMESRIYDLGMACRKVQNDAGEESYVILFFYKTSPAVDSFAKINSRRLLTPNPPLPFPEEGGSVEFERESGEKVFDLYLPERERAGGGVYLDVTLPEAFSKIQRPPPADAVPRPDAGAGAAPIRAASVADQIRRLNALSGKRRVTPIALSWPTNSTPTGIFQPIAATPSVWMKSGDAEAQTFRDLKMRLGFKGTGKPQKEVSLRFGEDGTEIHFDVLYPKSDQGTYVTLKSRSAELPGDLKLLLGDGPQGLLPGTGYLSRILGTGLAGATLSVEMKHPQTYSSAQIDKRGVKEILAIQGEEDFGGHLLRLVQELLGPEAGTLAESTQGSSWTLLISIKNATDEARLPVFLDALAGTYANYLVNLPAFSQIRVEDYSPLTKKPGQVFLVGPKDGYAFFKVIADVEKDDRTNATRFENERVEWALSPEDLALLDIDPHSPPVLSSDLNAALESGSVAVSFPGKNEGLGMRELSFSREGTRFDLSSLSFAYEAIWDPASSLLMVSLDNHLVDFETEAIRQPDGSVRHFIRRRDASGGDNLRKLQLLAGLTGHAADFADRWPTGQEIEIVSPSAVEGSFPLLGMESLFLRPVRLNRDGSAAVESIRLTQWEAQLIREREAGSAYEGAARDAAIDPSFLSSPSVSGRPEYAIAPGAVFKMTEITKMALEDLLSKGPLKEGEEIAFYLEYESEEGLVFCIPVKARNRTNPLELDAKGRFLLDGDGEILMENGVLLVDPNSGRRIETYIRGHEEATRRTVGYGVVSRDHGGRWNIHAVIPNKDGGDLAFNLSVVVHSDCRYLSALVDTRGPDGLVTPESVRRTRQAADQALSEDVDDYLEGTSQELFTLRLSQGRVESDGEAERFIYASGDSDGNRVFAELSGFRLSRTDRRIDLDDALTLRIKMFRDGVMREERTLNLQHSALRGDRVVILREMGGDGVGKSFIWNLDQQTLSETFRSRDDSLSEARRLDLIRDHHLPLFEKIGTSDVSDAEIDAAASDHVWNRVRNKGGSRVHYAVSEPISPVPADHAGRSFPAGRQIESVSSKSRWRDLEAQAPFHGAFLTPDKASALAMTLVGRDREYFFYRTAYGHIVLLPYREEPRYREVTPTGVREVGSRYLLSKEAVANHVVEARVLYPAKTSDHVVYDALINKEWQNLPAFEARGYQLTALNAISENLKGLKAAIDGVSGSSFEMEGTVVFPTGSGKTRVMIGAMARSLGLDLWQEGDKFIIATHLKGIRSQHLKSVIKELGPLFKEKTGRDIKVSAYAGDQDDFSGDVVLVSLPKVAQSVSRGGENFYDKLGKSIQGHSIPFVTLDEVHHRAGALSWQEFEKRIRNLSPLGYFLGLTATPTGEEPNVLSALKPLEMMQIGAIPNVNVLEAPMGASLSDLAPKSATGDFNVKEAVDRINTPALNVKVMSLMEKYGFRSPDGRSLAASLVLGLDGDHIWGMARAYVSYFGQQSDVEPALRQRYRKRYPLRGRKIEIVGALRDDRGNKINQSATQIRESLARKQRGEVDTLIFVYTGDLSDEARELIETAWEEGLLETGFADEAISEGKDLPWIQNLFANNPSLSTVKTAQFAGRITRYRHREIDHATGRLLEDRPRQAIQCIYTYSGQSKQIRRIREAYGYTHGIPPNIRFDIVRGKPSDDVPTHYEIADVEMHSVRSAGAHHGDGTLKFRFKDGTDEVFNLKETASTENIGNREIIGYQVLNSKVAAPSYQVNARTALDDTTEYYNLHEPPPLVSQGPDEGSPDYLKMSDGSSLKLQVEMADGAAADGDDVLRRVTGLQSRPALGELPPRTVLVRRNQDGAEEQWEVFEHENNSVLAVHDPVRDQWHDLYVSNHGEVCLIPQRGLETEFQSYAGSSDFEMTHIRGGKGYAENPHSLAFRRPIPTLDGARRSFEVTLILGRWSGAGHKSLKKPHVRFLVHEMKDGRLRMEKGFPREEDSGRNFVFGDDFELDFKEDAWQDPRDGQSHLGRVKIVLKGKAFESGAGMGDAQTLKPYATVDFSGRDGLLGPQFRVARAHYHDVTPRYDANKLMPDDSDYLIHGAGLLIGRDLFDKSDSHLFKGIEVAAGQRLFDKGKVQAALERHNEMHPARAIGIESLFEGLRALRGGKRDMPRLLHTLGVLETIGYTGGYGAELPPQYRELLSLKGDYRDDVLADLVHFGRSLTEGPVSQTPETEEGGCDTEGEEMEAVESDRLGEAYRTDEGLAGRSSINTSTFTTRRTASVNAPMGR